MKKIIQQLSIILVGIAIVFIIMGLVILTAPEHHKILIKFFGEIAMLQIFTILMIYFTDRYVIPLSEKQKQQTIKIFAPGLWLFYKFCPIFSELFGRFINVLIKYTQY